MRTRVQIIEDDQKLAELVQLWLEGAGYECASCESGAAGLQQAASWRPDLVILDLALPDMDGSQVCARLRESAPTPIIMLTARGGEVDRVRGLKLGADDYVVKPFSFPELVARVEAVLRRTLDPSGKAGCAPYRIGDLTIDVEAHRVWIGDAEVKLTPTEFRLLAYMAAHRGRLLTHGEILQAVWGAEYLNDVDSLRMYVRSLRQKIEIPAGPQAARPHYISTEYGLGYRFA